MITSPVKLSSVLTISTSRTADPAANGLKDSVKAWEESSIQLQAKMNDLMKILENE